MATCDPQEYLNLSKCFSCLNPKQLMEVRLALLCKILQSLDPMATCDVQTLLDAAKCFQCLDNKQMMMVHTQLLCEILAAGMTAESCLLCGNAEPTETPECDCALYYKTPEGYWYHWDAGLSQWILDLG